VALVFSYLTASVEYRLISKKGEGTFSEVLKAQSTKTNKYVAIKCMKAHFYNIEQVLYLQSSNTFQVNNLREIQALKRLSPHPNIITLHEVLYDEPTGRLALVFELMDMNMYEAIKGRRQYLPETRVKYYMYQVIKSIDHMHKNGIFHRDIKP
jgi:renal tumor antigen